MRLSASLIVALATGLMTAPIAQAAEPVELTLKNHSFTPAAIQVPANARFRMEIANQDPTPAEFESHDFRVEKIIPAGGRIAVMVGPLKPGVYSFFDDYHPDTAKGTATATEQQAGK